MLWFLLVPIIGIWMIADAFRQDSTAREFFNDGPVGLIIGVFFFVALMALTTGLCAGAAALVGLAFETHAVEAGRGTLVSLRDKDGVSGTFFLGSGQVKGEQYYFYYERMSDGSIRPGQVSANHSVRIYEEDRQDAELVLWTWKTADWGWWIALPVRDGGYGWDFHVPKGTIRTGYTM